MQKTTKHPKAATAKAGKASSTRKPLTPEQRKRKNERDRQRRARLRSEKKQAKQAKQVKQERHKCKCGKGCSCGRSAQQAPNTPDTLFRMIGEIVAGRIAATCGSSKVVAMSPLVECEPGVLRGHVKLANGCGATFTFVDGDEVSPLSRFSPVPPPVRHAMLLARMAGEISDIVDANIRALG